MTDVDLVIIGGGPAGMAAAIEAKSCGINDIVILEREGCLGGILPQCIHNGFGLHNFGEELTGPEYAWRYIDQIREMNINYCLDTTVLNIDQNKVITAVNNMDGMFNLKAKAIILGMGCRERTRGALNIPGTRPAGIYTAGTAQRFVNMEGLMPGKKVVILGSGDIGLIMARRMTLEGAEVKMVCELQSYSGGLTRNIVQCLEDFNIPLKLSHTIVDINGGERLEGVTVAQVDQNKVPLMESAEYVECDTLLLSVGLIPENELSEEAGIILDPVTAGPVVNECMETSVPGIFACGNAVHVHDLVDYVSKEGAAAGKNAANYILKGKEQDAGNVTKITAGKGVRYTVPQLIADRDDSDGDLQIFFRVTDIYKNVRIVVKHNDGLIYEQKKKKVAPGEMECIRLPWASLKQVENLEELVVEIDDKVIKPVCRMKEVQHA